MKESDMKESSVFDAIRNGQWDFEPETVPESEFENTSALPGTNEKVDVLAERASAGLPLWHSADRQSYDDTEKAWI
jgi:hypothetical protein